MSIQCSVAAVLAEVFSLLDITLFSLLKVSLCFGGACYFHLEG
jgi:hypothetical protein